METQCRGGHRAAVCVRGGVSQLALCRQSDGRYPARQPAAAGGEQQHQGPGGRGPGGRGAHRHRRGHGRLRPGLRAGQLL